MKNMLLEKVDYQVERTYFGTWRRYAYETGARFAEFKSHDGLLGLPFIHYTAGICPETGKRLVAKGIIAVGRKAVGVVAVGQAAAGLLALGQLAVGAVAIGQAAFGIAVIGQLAIAILFGLGQVTTGTSPSGSLPWVITRSPSSVRGTTSGARGAPIRRPSNFSDHSRSG